MDDIQEYVICDYCEDRVFTYFFSEGLCTEHFIAKTNHSETLVEG